MTRLIVRGRVLGLIAVAAASMLAAAAQNRLPAGGGATAPPNAKVYGKSLTEWIGAYWTWYYATGQNLGIYPTPGPFRPGPSPVVFMPMPGALDSTWTGGDGSPDNPVIGTGTIHVQLKTGTGFVTPAFAWIGERYQGYPGVADDTMIPNDALRLSVFNPAGLPGAVPSFTLDGKPLLRDFWAYSVGPKAFNPPVEYPAPSSYGSVAAIAFQGVGMVVNPLPPGRHVMHLYERLRLTPAETGFSMGVVYDNTWIIDVMPDRGPRR